MVPKPVLGADFLGLPLAAAHRFAVSYFEA